jgi:hypothetical protein
MLHRRQWTRPDTPTSAQLNGVAVAGGRAYAAGNRGLLLGRIGGGWVRLLGGGVAGESRGLLDVAPTDDGARLWICGPRGALGYYDTDSGAVTDCSEPYGLNSTLRTLSVDGAAGAENVHVGDDQGRIARLTLEGAEATVRGVAVPGPNEPITELRTADGLLSAADTTGRIHQSNDGRTWRTDHLASGAVTALAVDAGGLLAATRDGTVYTGIRSFSSPPDRVAPLPEGVQPSAADGRGHTAIVVDRNGSLLARGRDPGFQPVGVESSAGLYAVTIAADGVVYAAGADGLIVEGRTA